jgi:integrase
MSNFNTVKLYTLPILRLTRVSDQPGPGFLPVHHQHAGKTVKYWRERQGDKAARWTTFPKFPLVLNADGSPWESACLWLLDRAQAKPLRLSSLASIAQGLKDYRLFLDDLGLEWDDFSAVDKYNRPTYLYRTHLQGLIDVGQIKRTTASGRMSAVIGFYRFLMGDPRMRFEPLNKPWAETRLGFEYRDSRGFAQIKEVVSTDVSIRVSKRDYAWEESIADGGKLRPLTVREQQCLVEALKRLDNPEYSLMHYVALLTGARVQTVLTLRVASFLLPAGEVTQWPDKLRCGPGTGIDTKRDVTDVYLSVPHALYQMLHVYALSDRAKRRRGKSVLGEDKSNYLFLTNQGAPYYESKDDRNAERYSVEPLRRSSPIGQNLREFISEHVIPEVGKTLPNFKYSFHDLRATFGMNWVDHVVGAGGTKEKYLWARDQLRKLMWHKDPATTDHYLEYRQHMRHLQTAQAGWSQHLVNLINAS